MRMVPPSSPLRPFPRLVNHQLPRCQSRQLIFLILTLAFLACAPLSTSAKSVSMSLELRQPRPLKPDSTKGFHSVVHIHEPIAPPRHKLHGFVRRLFTTRAQKKFHSVELYGGMVAVGEYYAKVKIGGQTLRVQIDTGSATLAVPLKECKNCKRGDMRYSVKDSTSGIAEYLSCEHGDCGSNTCRMGECGACSSARACCSKTNKEHCAFHLNFGDGSGAKGVLVRDELQWGDVKFPVSFGGINSDSPDFERSQVDGILGMAYPSLACNPSCVVPTFDAMLKTFPSMKDMFSICITYDSGRIVLGDYDPLLSTQKISWVPLALSPSPSFYSFPVVGNLLVNDKELQLPDYSRAIVDSGTTLIVFTHATFNKFKTYLQANFCDVPGLCDEETWFKPAHCTKIKDDERMKLPTLKIRLQGFDILMGPSDYLINYASKGPQYWCVGIMALDAMSGGVDVILGNTVMKKYVTIYDREKKNIGFAESDTNCGSDVKKGNTILPGAGSEDDGKGGASGTADESDYDGSSDGGLDAEGGDDEPSSDGEPNPQKAVPKANNPEDILKCSSSRNCSSCLQIEGSKCSWDSSENVCVPGDGGWPLMCSIANLEAKLFYIIGGAVAAVIAAIVVVALVVHSYRKRRVAEAEAAGSGIEEGDVQQPLAPNRNRDVDSRSAFAIED